MPAGSKESHKFFLLIDLPIFFRKTEKAKKRRNGGQQRNGDLQLFASFARSYQEILVLTVVFCLRFSIFSVEAGTLANRRLRSPFI